MRPHLHVQRTRGDGAATGQRERLRQLELEQQEGVPGAVRRPVVQMQTWCRVEEVVGGGG